MHLGPRGADSALVHLGRCKLSDREHVSVVVAARSMLVSAVGAEEASGPAWAGGRCGPMILFDIVPHMLEELCLRALDVLGFPARVRQVTQALYMESMYEKRAAHLDNSQGRLARRVVRRATHMRPPAGAD